MFTIKTERIELRPFQENDLDACRFDGQRGLHELFAGPLSREKTAEFLEKMRMRDRAGEPSQFAVLLHATGKLIGFCGFFLQYVDGIERIEIAYRFHPDYWGRGIATEAARAVHDHAFQVLKLNQVISLIHPDNIASSRVAEKMQ